MNFFTMIEDPKWWQTLLGNDFNLGFVSALIIILILMIIMFILRTILCFIFRTRRCSFVEIKRQDGNTIVNREIISSLVDRELKDYPALNAEKIVLTRRKQKYQLTIYCSYLLSDPSGIPAFCDEFKPRLLTALEKGFGMTNLVSIRLWINNPDENGPDDNTEEPCTAAAKDAYIGL